MPCGDQFVQDTICELIFDYCAPTALAIAIDNLVILERYPFASEGCGSNFKSVISKHM